MYSSERLPFAWPLALTAGASSIPLAHAGDMGDAFRTLFSQPFGWALAAAIAAGLVCFGLFQLLHARYARL